jgi:hypothetical protein
MIRVVHPGSRIRMLTFSHPGSRIQGSKRHPIPDPGSGSETLVSGFHHVSGFVTVFGFGIQIRIQEGKQLRISGLSAVSKTMKVKKSYKVLAKKLFDTSRGSRHMYSLSVAK